MPHPVTLHTPDGRITLARRGDTGTVDAIVAVPAGGAPHYDLTATPDSGQLDADCVVVDPRYVDWLVTALYTTTDLATPTGRYLRVDGHRVPELRCTLEFFQRVPVVRRQLSPGKEH